jgi:hypothetical protein
VAMVGYRRRHLGTRGSTIQGRFQDLDRVIDDLLRLLRLLRRDKATIYVWGVEEEVGERSEGWKKDGGFGSSCND